ncbi:MAG: isoprenyl transferase [Verrucomicrobiia bacterium]
MIPSPVELEIQPAKVDLNIPQHVAVIMDGNGRWAAERGLPRILGHEEGARSIKACVEGCLEFGIRYLTLYAFSTENWKRPRQEVEALMRLLDRYLRENTEDLLRQNIELAAIGRLGDLPDSCRSQLLRTMAATKGRTALTVIFALSYSGRAEIVDALRQIAAQVKAGVLQPEEIDEALVSANLYTNRWPDPDLLIRTSGEMRVSNFLLWQVSYTELYVTPVFWPDFGKEHFAAAIRDFTQRKRRYGAL